ncbi:MAG: sensor histidine kinase [Bacteroidota bacterium]
MIPKLYFKKRYLIYASLIVILFVAICILPSLLTGRNPFESAPLLAKPLVGAETNSIPPLPAGSTFVQEIKHHIYLFAAVMFFSILLRIWWRLLQTEQARHNAEIVALKDQINPHFLFNTLNGLYALAVRDKSTTTASGILKLSALMRYVVTETGNGFVSLERELSYINDYIDLQKLRLDKRVQLSYRVMGSLEKQQIAPLTLMPFIENAFKHGVNPDEDSSINILIDVNRQELKLVVENNKVHVALDAHEKSGKGIQNTKSRLNLFYPSRHFLILDEDEKHFRVQLTIQIS